MTHSGGPGGVVVRGLLSEGSPRRCLVQSGDTSEREQSDPKVLQWTPGTWYGSCVVRESCPNLSCPLWAPVGLRRAGLGRSSGQGSCPPHRDCRSWGVLTQCRGRVPVPGTERCPLRGCALPGNGSCYDRDLRDRKRGKGKRKTNETETPVSVRVPRLGL